MSGIQARPLESTLPADHRSVASTLGPRDLVLYVPAHYPQGDLHHQSRREHQRSVMASGKDVGTFPQRWGCHQAAQVGPFMLMPGRAGEAAP
mgnify:FL=1